MTNLGDEHGHYTRMNEFKLNSELLAPRFYMFRDHKSVGGWRPVVSESLPGTIICHLLNRL